MAQKIQVQLTDDLTGGEATQNIRFAFNGIEYEIDLNDENADALQAALAKYILAGRRLRGAGRPGRPATTTVKATVGPRVDLAEVRAWARENGFTVSDRGRVSDQVRGAYDAAHV